VSESADVTACFSQRVGAWFAGECRASVADPVHLRQMNMAIALAASRWNEFAGDPDAVLRMGDWLVEVRRRAVERKAHARVEAIDRARAWFDACSGSG
jgi:hypothetical protein